MMLSAFLTIFKPCFSEEHYTAIINADRFLLQQHAQPAAPHQRSVQTFFLHTVDNMRSIPVDILRRLINQLGSFPYSVEIYVPLNDSTGFKTFKHREQYDDEKTIHVMESS
jgi:hypothetical protein